MTTAGEIQADENEIDRKFSELKQARELLAVISGYLDGYSLEQRNYLFRGASRLFWDSQFREVFDGLGDV